MRLSRKIVSFFAGAAMLAAHRLEGRARKTSPPDDAMKGGYLGPQFSNEEIEGFLRAQEAPRRWWQWHACR